MNPHVSIITLGVRDFIRAKQFYSEGLGWPIHQEQGEWVAFSLADGSSALALYPWDESAHEAGVGPMAMDSAESVSRTTFVPRIASMQD